MRCYDSSYKLLLDHLFNTLSQILSLANANKRIKLKSKESKYFNYQKH